MNIETSCEQCIFSLWDQYSWEQSGCFFKRLEKFKEVGVKVEKQGNHYKIGAMCNRCFQMEKVPQNAEELLEAAKLAIEKSSITCDMLIAPNNEGELSNYITLFKSLDPNPNKLFVLDKNRLNEKFARMLSLEEFKWQTFSGDNVNWDDAIDKTESQFFWIPTEWSAPQDLLQIVDNIWNEKLLQFFCIEGKYGTVVGYDMYKMFVNQCDNMVDKFKSIDEKFDLKLGKKVYTWEEILALLS